MGRDDRRRLRNLSDVDSISTLPQPDIIEVPSASPEVLPLLTVIPLQLLAYYMADLKGTDVDQPRNLAKTVTVE